MKKKLISMAAVAAMAILGQSCATGLSKSEYGVKVQSNPAGKDFSITNKKGEVVHVGTTPEVVYLKSQSDFFEGEDYKYSIGNKSMNITAKTSWFYYINVFSGFIGYAVDPITGAAYDLPDRATLNLKGESSSDFGALTGGDLLP